MGRSSEWGLNEKLRWLYQLWTGQSISLQYNILSELQSLVHWDQAVLLAPTPWILPYNEAVPFPVPDRPCPAGLWSCDPMALQGPAIPVSIDLPDPLWNDWGNQIAQHYHLQTWILMIIDLVPPCNPIDQTMHQMPILFLRKSFYFNDAEITILRLLYDALKHMTFYFLTFENLLHHYNNDYGDCSRSTDSSTPSDLVIIDRSPWRLQSYYTDDRLKQSIHPSILDPIDQRTEICISDSLRTLGLTPRQSQVMYLILKGKELNSIAQELGCREATVRKHIENLYRRLGVQTRTAAIAQVLESIGIV